MGYSFDSTVLLFIHLKIILNKLLGSTSFVVLCSECSLLFLLISLIELKNIEAKLC